MVLFGLRSPSGLLSCSSSIRRLIGVWIFRVIVTLLESARIPAGKDLYRPSGAYTLVEVMLERGSEHTQVRDEQLVRTMAEGDENALGALWDRHARPVYSLAHRILRDPGWAEEVVQDVFVRLWSDPRKYDPSRGELRPWLLTVTHHAAVDGLRGRRGTATNRETGPESLEFMPFGGEDPSESASNSLRAESVRTALLELPSEQREVMEMVYFGGFTQRETAEKTGQPLGTVKSRLRLGMQKLRSLLTEIGPSE